MNKITLLGAVILSALTLSGNNAFAQNKDGEEAMNSRNQKVLVAYYSYSGNTKEVAEAIHKKIGGDLFEITSNHTYPDDYTPMTEQAKKEIQDGFRPELTSKVADIAQYDIIFLGSPIWWGTITPAVSSFLESYDLSGKTVIPFITHGGGGASNSFRDLSAQCKGCLVTGNGWAGYGSRTLGLTGWLEDLGLNK